MKVGQFLFKPKWQHTDAATRRAEVAESQDAELVAALPLLAQRDPDAGVRLAALKRLNDYELWRERSTGDVDGQLRQWARAAYVALLVANGPGAPSLQRRIAELETLSIDELERVAATASDIDLRASALALVARPGFLIERATLDPDPRLRLAALARVSEPAALERISERARKTDKVVSRIARERLHALRLAAGDAGTLTEHARALCERVEALLRVPDTAARERLDTIDREWAALSVATTQDFATRYQGARALLVTALDPARIPSVPEVSPEQPLALTGESGMAAAPGTQPEAPTPTGSETDIHLPADAPMDVATSALVAQVRFAAALAAADGEAGRRREHQQALLQRIDQSLAHLAAALDTGDSAAAHLAHAQVTALLQAHSGSPPASTARRLATLEARYAEIKRWHHWSNNLRRRTLCAEIEALGGTSLHPDAIATRVREARDEWQRLDAAETPTAETSTARTATGGLARRFHAICHQALKPTREYFVKREQVRKSHRQDLESLLARAAAVAADTTEWKPLAALRQETSAALRTLDGVDPRERGTLAKRLKESIARLAAILERHEREVDQTKCRLIERAQALSAQSDQLVAVREARALQKQWQAAGAGKRGADQRQWRDFRTACDAVFARLDAERQQREAQATSARAQTEALLAELDVLARSEALSATALKQQLRDWDSRWRTAAATDRSTDRATEQRYRKAHAQVSAHVEQLARTQRLSRYTLALEKFELVRQLESGILPGANVAARWATLPELTPEFELPIAARYARAQNAAAEFVDVVAEPGTESDVDQPQRDLLVRLEYLAGIESPARDRQRRMDLQVRRLAARMRGTAQVLTPDAEVSALLVAWFAQPGTCDAEQLLRFERAIRAILDALP